MTETPTTPADYDPKSFELLHEAESRHFWFDARRRRIMKYVAPLVANTAKVLEVGAGTGYVAEGFVQRGYTSYALGDMFSEALHYTHTTLPQVPACQFDVFNPPFRADFDAVFLFDVIAPAAGSQSPIKTPRWAAMRSPRGHVGKARTPRARAAKPATYVPVGP